MTTRPERIRRAIEIIEDSRRTHVDVLNYQQGNPNWKRKHRLEDIGSPAFHRKCITEYEEVLTLLRTLR